MKFTTMILAASLAIASSTAFASSCPKHMKAIDAALPTAKLDAAKMAQVKKLRADGEALHKAGKHGESMEALNTAERLLGI